MDLKLLPILFLLIGCNKKTDQSEMSSETTRLDSSYWKAESIVMNAETLNLSLDHLYYRILDSVTGQWNLLNDTLINEVPEESCLHWTVWSDTIVFGVPCSNFKFNAIKPCYFLDSNHICSEYVRVFIDQENQYMLENSSVIFRQNPIPQHFSNKIHSIFTDSPDTFLIVK